MFERKSISVFKSAPSSFKKLEWQLAQELDKLDQQLSRRTEEEFEERLHALVDEYQADPATVLAALQGEAEEVLRGFS